MQLLNWCRTVAELAEQKFPGKYQIEADPSAFKGDLRPVENVSFNMIGTWIHALNELSQAGEPALRELIPDHQPGDVYRLPTEAEWEFVVRGRNLYTSRYHSTLSGGEDPPGPTRGTYRVLRGGSWHSIAQDVGSASRTYDFPHSRYNFFGFRLARKAR